MNSFAWIVVQTKPLLPIGRLVADHPADVGDLSSLGSPKGFGKGLSQGLASVGNRLVNGEMSLAARLFWHGSFPPGASTRRLYHKNAESVAKPDRTHRFFLAAHAVLKNRRPEQPGLDVLAVSLLLLSSASCWHAICSLFSRNIEEETNHG